MNKFIKPTVIPLLFSALFSSACVPVALVAAGATIGGAVIYDKRPVETMVQDRNAASELLKKISNDQTLSSQTHINIATFNNVMLITGQANSEDLRNQVYQMASNTSQIKRIYNEITIEPPTTKEVQNQDTWITTKVKGVMLAEKGLSSSQTKVVTENGVVYLLGMVTHKQADLAADVTSKVTGVKKVVRIFEYD